MSLSKNELYINSKSTLINAIKKMDGLDCKLLIVVENNNDFHSLISIGDIQRFLIKKQSLDHPISDALRQNIKVAHKNDSLETIKTQMIEFRMEYMPVINSKNRVEKIIFWDELINDLDKDESFSKIDCPVVIMAGGKGTRLKPITNIIPKPLIPIGDKTILELIIERFIKVGSNEFHLSVNYKAEMIENYMKEIKPTFNINYFYEDKPLGTAGSLHLIKHKINKTFFVSNCDILIDQDYTEIYRYHKENKNKITLVSALKHYSMPYGILDVAEDGILNELKEKPDLTYQVNAGLYILEPEILAFVPEEEIFHITDLIQLVKDKGERVGVFPVSEKSLSDIGEWKEYNATAEKLGLEGINL